MKTNAYVYLDLASDPEHLGQVMMPVCVPPGVNSRSVGNPSFTDWSPIPHQHQADRAQHVELHAQYALLHLVSHTHTHTDCCRVSVLHCACAENVYIVGENIKCPFFSLSVQHRPGFTFMQYDMVF